MQPLDDKYMFDNVKSPKLTRELATFKSSDFYSSLVKSRYEVDEITSDYGDGPAAIYGYYSNVHSLNDFQESFSRAEAEANELRNGDETQSEQNQPRTGEVIPDAKSTPEHTRHEKIEEDSLIIFKIVSKPLKPK
ncbi:hypothetical protein INT45_001230 [Circinella minor]|uniref:Uncharacterized protein n=1 Tax=Circinella minor TaxID=1195481 RepID=A0A8H7S832_9FUNG|nr:hypothetical protein INT45_001230 [Circinella minor]